MTLWLSCGYYPSWISLHYKEPKWNEKRIQWEGYTLACPSDIRKMFPKLPLPGELLEIEVTLKETWVMVDDV